MHENGKMMAVETVPGMEWGKVKENDGGSKFNCDML
jgi:hypothetical protein